MHRLKLLVRLCVYLHVKWFAYHNFSGGYRIGNTVYDVCMIV